MGQFYYDNKTFRSVSNSDTGEVSDETTFLYRQKNNIVWATYEGGKIVFGTLTGTADDDGVITFAYQHVNADGEIMTGRCTSTPERISDGRIRLHESWQWTSGDHSAGESVIEEV